MHREPVPHSRAYRGRHRAGGPVMARGRFQAPPRWRLRLLALAGAGAVVVAMVLAGWLAWQ